MCNDIRNRIPTRAIQEAFGQIRIPLIFPTGAPNLEPREDIRITDTAPIVRVAAGEPGAAELVQRRWSWPDPRSKKPVFNFRAEGRRFPTGRCLAPADGFYEFTAPADPKQKRKDKWLFTLKDEPWFCIAGLWRDSAEVGEAFTLLTVDPGPDIAPFHDRQIVVLRRDQWGAWLDPATPEREVLKALPAGSFHVEKVG